MSRKLLLLPLLAVACAAAPQTPAFSLDVAARSGLVGGGLPDNVPIPDIHVNKDSVTIDLTSMVLSNLAYQNVSLTVGTDLVATVTGASASLAFAIKARENIWPHPSLTDTGTLTMKNANVVLTVKVDGTSTIDAKAADVSLGDVDLKLDKHTDVAWLTDKLIAAFKDHIGKAIGDALVANMQNVDLLAIATSAMAGRTVALPDVHEAIPGGGSVDLTTLELDSVAATSLALAIPAPNQLELAVGGAVGKGAGKYAYKELIVHGSGTVALSVGSSAATVTLAVPTGSDLDTIMVGDPTTLQLGDIKVELSGKVLQVVADVVEGAVKKVLEKDFKEIVASLLPGGAAPAALPYAMK